MKEYNITYLLKKSFNYLYIIFIYFLSIILSGLEFIFILGSNLLPSSSLLIQHHLEGHCTIPQIMLTNFLSIFIKLFPEIYELLISYLIYVSLALATIDKRIEFSWACSSHNFQKQYSNSHKVFHISNT